MDDDLDCKDDTKRKSRNLSEKKRRDQFNLLVNELSTMVSTANRKMDKSTVLKSTIAFLRQHNEIIIRSRAHEIQEDWKPSFLSNEEFTHLILEALDCFIIVFSSNGQIFYASESIASLLGYLPSDLLSLSIYDLAYEDHHTDLYNLLLHPPQCLNQMQSGLNEENRVTFCCYIKKRGLNPKDETIYELVEFVGYFRSDIDIENMLPAPKQLNQLCNENNTNLIFIGTGQVQTPQLIREMTIVDSSKSEFTSRHSLEWKFLFLDHRAPPIIGYLPFEVLGTSGYDYYHFDDLEKVQKCHEALMQKGEGTSCYYRFLTKGHQWIWIQTRFYITYHQWNSKPEFVVCTHRVISYADVMKNFYSSDNKYLQSENLSCNGSDKCQILEDTNDSANSADKGRITTPASLVVNSPWSSRSSKTSRFAVTPSSHQSTKHRHQNYQGPGSDSTSLSADSPASRYSTMTHNSSRSHRRRPPNSMILRSQSENNHNHRSSNTQSSQLSSSSFSQSSQQQSMVLSPENASSVGSLQSNQTLNTQSIGSQFIEPTSQYVTTIPMVQPILAAPSLENRNPNIMPPVKTLTQEILQPSNIVMSSAQSQIQDQLQRKHEELQQLILQQQEELRRVSEQLVMARYGILSPSLVNVASLQFNASIPNQNSNSNAPFPCSTLNTIDSGQHHQFIPPMDHRQHENQISYNENCSMPTNIQHSHHIPLNSEMISYLPIGSISTPTQQDAYSHVRVLNVANTNNAIESQLISIQSYDGGLQQADLMESSMVPPKDYQTEQTVEQSDTTGMLNNKETQ